MGQVTTSALDRARKRGGEAGYSPVQETADGRVEVALGADHPGLCDPVYRRRRNELAELALGWAPGEPLPRPAYTEVEHDVWRQVSDALARAHRERAAASFLAGAEALALPRDHVPQLDEVNERLQPLGGFSFVPVAGLAPLRRFYESFGEGKFSSTQYLRHPSNPLYTPEPDLVHEVIGHANQLADPAWAAVYREVAAAVRRLETAEALGPLSRVFWFTAEFGVVWERPSPAAAPQVRAVGAGLLSSIGELAQLDHAEVRPLDLDAAAVTEYDITVFQPVLFGARSTTHLLDQLHGFLAAYDDDTPARLGLPAG